MNAIVHLAQRIETEINAYLDELSRRNETPVPGMQQRHQCTETARRAQDDYDVRKGGRQSGYPINYPINKLRGYPINKWRGYPINVKEISDQ